MRGKRDRGRPSAAAGTRARWPALVLAAAIVAGCASPLPAIVFPEGAVRVPQDWPTIQAAIDAAGDGDLILVSPGVYVENLVIDHKAVTLASWFLVSRDSRHTDATVIQGRHGTTISVFGEGEGPTRIVGLTLRDGKNGIEAHGARLEVLDDHILHQRNDGVGLESSEAVVRGNRLEANFDDGVDCDGPTHGTIENNEILYNKDDGIELRLHPYAGAPIAVVMRGNMIIGNHGDGIQLINYPGLTDRSIQIERNVLQSNRATGVASMARGKTIDDFRGAPLEESVLLVNNTFASNEYGLIGGDNMIVLNNIFLGNHTAAVKRLGGECVASHNLLWRRGDEAQGCDVALADSLRTDPRLDRERRPTAGSPAIDAGITKIMRDGRELTVAPAGSYRRSAPDLGAFESD